MRFSKLQVLMLIGCSMLYCVQVVYHRCAQCVSVMHHMYSLHFIVSLRLHPVEGCEQIAEIC